ncbi:MAG: ParA family protein [Runella sp.]
MRTITFFNNKGGVGKTTTVYHIAWMLSELGIKTIVVDLDPQSNLTSMFLSEQRLEEIYGEEEQKITILEAITPIKNGDSFVPVHVEKLSENLGLILGNLALSTFEDTLSDAWLRCLNSDNYSFRITSLFKIIIDDAASRFDAEIVLIDVGPNLGAINRAVVITSDYLIMPVASDLFSLQGIKNIGKTLQHWKDQWLQRMNLKPSNLNFSIPQNSIRPSGYIVLQHSAKESRPVGSYLKWANRIPKVFGEYILKVQNNVAETVENDKNCIALLKHYRSLAPMSMEVRKPIFLLRPADGAIGAHVYAVQRSYDDFKNLTLNILEKCPPIITTHIT